MCWAVLAFFGFLLWALTQQPDTLQALIITPMWFVALGIAVGIGIYVLSRVVRRIWSGQAKAS